STPSLTATFWPCPAPSSSTSTRSSPSGLLSLRPWRLNGTARTQRNPWMVGCQRQSVTVPITSAMRMAVQLREGLAQPLRAYRGDVRGAPQQLPQLEVRPAVGGQGDQVRAE